MTDRESPRILVAGAINTDLVMHVVSAPDAGETVTGQSFGTFGGGKGANQAVAAARSGARVAILGGTGDDDFGRQRRDDLDQDGISLDAISVFPELPSGVAIILIEPGGQNRIAYVPGATRGVTPRLAIAALDMWQPGAVLATLEHQPETLRELWRTARARGVPVICNATPEPAAGRELALAADILIVNEGEALELLGEKSQGKPWPAVAEALRKSGAETAIITLGKEGAYVSSHDGDLSVPAVNVDAVDTTGAGDAFCGAFTAAFARGQSVFEAARVGVVAGSLAVTRTGAQPSMPYLEVIDSVLSASFN